MSSPAMRWAARLALIVHLVCVHLSLFRTWYGTGLRESFAKKENVHVKDLLLAIDLAEGSEGPPEPARGSSPKQPPPLPGRQAGEPGRLALLFMLRRRLEHVDAWRGWLAPELGRSTPRISLYFHLADGCCEDEGSGASAAELLALPGARQVVRTVATGWCELMAAEVALYRAALADDPAADLFVLLPHDAVPLAPLGNILATLMRGRGADSRPWTRFCPSGVRSLELPADCAHAIEPHWSRALLLKHHQWSALSRVHAERIAEGLAMRAAVELFKEWYFAQPLCSDEVIPLLALATPDAVLHRAGNLSLGTEGGALPTLDEIPLYAGATRGLAPFEEELRAIGAAAECLLYAPWPGCHGNLMGSGKRAKSPVVGGGLLPEERDSLMGELVLRGVLFGRKLGLGRGSPGGHLDMITSYMPPDSQKRGLPFDGATPLPAAPPRLLPEEHPAPLDLLQYLGLVPTYVKWNLASLEARVPLPVQIVGAIALAVLMGWASVHGGAIDKKSFRSFLAVYIAGHLVVFFLSIALHAEYSMLQPFRQAGLLAKAEI